MALSTRRYPAHPVSALILHPREIQGPRSHNYDTGSYVVPGRQQYYNVMPAYTRQLPRCTEREKNKRKINTKCQIKNEVRVRVTLTLSLILTQDTNRQKEKKHTQGARARKVKQIKILKEKSNEEQIIKPKRKPLRVEQKIPRAYRRITVVPSIGSLSGTLRWR